MQKTQRFVHASFRLFVDLGPRPGSTAQLLASDLTIDIAPALVGAILLRFWLAIRESPLSIWVAL